MNSQLYGLMAEFADAERLLEAARAAYRAGYRELDAYSPFPVDGLAEALGHKRSPIPMIVFIGGVMGALVAYGMQYYSTVWSYPLNIGGRPLHSWPAFVPIAFELTVLFAACAAFFGMLFLNRLPMPYHPVFNVPNFSFASQDRFFLCLPATDPVFGNQTKALLESFNPIAVHVVET